MSSDVSSLLLAAILIVGVMGLLFAVLGFLAVRRIVPGVSRDDAQALLRTEGEAIRAAAESGAGQVRQEILHTVSGQHTALIDRLAQSANGLRDALHHRLETATATQAQAAREMREELSTSFQRMRAGVGDELRQMSEHQKERLEATQAAIRALADVHKQGGEQLRASVEQRLDLLREGNEKKLEEMRRTVDEQLQTTLEKRLGESFNRVVEQLNKAYEVFGEMKNISAHVGDLKNVLTNPKLRGTFGEVQLSMLLQDFLAPSQYVANAQVREHSAERVEFAIRLPSADGEEVLLPVDAKFPREDHEAMIAAHEAGDMALADHHRKELEKRIKLFAKDICRKYINPPRTTERAILFLPTESLFAEVLRQPGLFDHVQRECNVMLAGPTTFAAILHAFQVNHRSMAIAQRSGEIWNTLSAVRTEFQNYNSVVTRLSNQLKTASNSVEALGVRTRAMDRALKKVETMPDEGAAAKLLGLDAAVIELDAEAELDAAADNVAKLATRVAATP
jgi:DNA recombination protein RmuC